MKISRKTIAVLLFTSALVLTLVVASLNTLIDKNRDRIREEIQKTLGRAIKFDDLRLSFWGGLGLSAKHLRIAEDTRFAATPFIQTKELKMQVRWLPLLLGYIEIKKFILDEPEIQIIKNEAKNLNISALAKPQRGTKKTREVKGGKRRYAPTLLISAIRVTNGKIYYIDRSFKEPVEIRIRNLDMDLRGLALTGTTEIKLAANLFEGQGQNMSVEGRVGPFGDGGDWTRYPLDLQVHVDSVLLPQLTRAIPFLRDKISPGLGITGPLMLQAKFLGTFERPRISDLTLTGSFFSSTSNNTTVSGELDLSKGGSWRDSQIKGKMIVDPVSLDHLKKIPLIKQALPASLISEGPLRVASELQGNLENLKVHTLIKARESEIRYGGWLKKGKGIPAQMELKVRRQKNRLIFEESALTLHNLKLKFSGQLEELPERRLTLHLRTDGVNLSDWDGLLLPLSPYSMGGKLRWDFSIKKNLGLQDGGLDIRGTLNLDDTQVKDKKTGRGLEKVAAQVFFRGKEARIEDSSFRLGSSDVAFKATLPNFSQPTLRYTLRSPKLNLADLTGLSTYKADEMKALQSTGELQMGKGKTKLRGDLSSSEGTLQGILYRNLRGKIAWSPRSVSFKNLSVQALSGTFRVNGAWETGAKNSQRLALNSNIRAVDLKAQLSHKFPKFKDHIEGQLNFRAKLRGGSKNGSTLQESLQGEGETQIRYGSLKDFNLVERVLSKVTGLPGISNLLSSRMPSRYSTIFKRRDTPFDTLAATFSVEQGRIQTEDLLLSTPDYSINGKGWIGFDKTMKWNATLIMSPQFTQELMKKHKNVRYMLDRQGRLAVPFRLKGTLPNVQAKPDLKGLVKAIQRGLLRRGIERALGGKKDKKKKGKRDWIQKGLEQLFGK
ncbi:MAG: AsmA family protein [Candidatus Binatia bacterium]